MGIFVKIMEDVGLSHPTVPAPTPARTREEWHDELFAIDQQERELTSLANAKRRSLRTTAERARAKWDATETELQTHDRTFRADLFQLHRRRMACKTALLAMPLPSSVAQARAAVDALREKALSVDSVVTDDVRTGRLRGDGRPELVRVGNEGARRRVLEAIRLASITLDALPYQKVDDVERTVAEIMSGLERVWARLGELDPPPPAAA